MRGRGETVQTAWPPSCLYPRFARAPFSLTHASPSPTPCPGLCTARLRRSAGAAPALPWTSKQRRVSVRERPREEGGEVSGGGGGRGGASRLRRRPHFPRAAAAVVRCGLLAAMLCSRRARRCRRRCGRGVRTPCRPDPRAFSHWRKATAGGLARDWSVAGRPRTWHVIGRAGSGLGGDEGIGGCRDARVWGSLAAG